MAKLQASGDALSELYVQLRGQPALSAAAVERAYRTIADNAQRAELKVAWLGNHTLDPIARRTTVSAFTRGLTLAHVVGSYDQYFQAVLDESSDVLEFEPDALVLWLSLRRLAPLLVEGGGSRSEAQWSGEQVRVLDRVQQWVSQAKQRTRASLLVCNFARPPSSRLGIADTRSPTSEAALYGRLNGRLLDLYRDDPRVFVVDVDQAIADHGRRDGWDPRMYRLAKIEWDGPAAVSVANLIARTLSALVRPARKCLVLDLDNILWGGVVGEDGPDGINVAEGDAVGESFLAFQRAVLDIKGRGILLAICSKNNLEDVAEVFGSVTMPLGLRDFAAQRVNWSNKHENLLEIARELNIGTDSLVFVDDSPAECELVRQMLPDVTVVQLPADPADYAATLLDLQDFDKLVITDEDLQKTVQYQGNAARESQRANATDLETYLESLGTRLRTAPVGPGSSPRVHQLFNKTNQFNCTTKRYTLPEIEQLAESEDWLFELVQVSDHFGDLGIVGAYLVDLRREEPEIDSFVLSCRAMGRGIETAICNRIKQLVLVERASPALRARFIPTRKNEPASRFFESQGFEIVERASGGAKVYRLGRDQSRPMSCPGIRITEEQ